MTITDWVRCPICKEHHMERTTDEDGNSLIFCTNHACRSNGGITKGEPSTVADWCVTVFIILTGVWALLHALNKV